ncbi:MAG: DNA-directed RNA polymerase subunit beta' [Chloroflexota bacterium]|nr:DNA-directed RNA polymerase subunit beta' [Chloroflexota bacterium]MDE2886243.1 DNA-directed RNA polymerase subunit beta' [Chloroflexota bacterium]
MPNATDFNAIRISLASPEQVKQWSYGEVLKPETINYRTLRPEKDGLFCERIFGPTKDWECYCGKYKKIRYRGVICDRCGVEVARAKVRRERMGHISLAAPVAHIWFAKGIPSRLGLLLDISPRNLERVLYFAQYIVTRVDPLLQTRRVEELQLEHDEKKEELEQQMNQRIATLEEELESLAGSESSDAAARRKTLEDQLSALVKARDEQMVELDTSLSKEKDEVESLKLLMLLTESRHRELSDRYGDVFRAGMGAEAILDILRSLDLQEEMLRLKEEVRTTSGQRRKKAVKRIQVIEAFHSSGNKPEWMIMTALPVLPPDLRPMVQLDGGRFATSDLNDLYRRVINRNNRLKRLLDLGAPAIIIRNEKRMLQEAVDDLIDNGRRGRAIVGSHNHQLKSLSDLLRGKQGRFRQNLLGKRVDYGGRSVIVVGPSLRLHECGLPKKMALELFKPFVMNRLVMQGMAHNIKSAKRMVERARPEVWDILEEVIQTRPVMLNRAPTLHRLGIQAFMPTLVEGSAIQLHPLVCAAFNADFDGDQMAVHVPLSREAVQEARNVMLSTHNMLSPSSGEPLVAPTYEIVLGCYYLTQTKEGAKGEGGRYRDFDDVLVAFDAGILELHSVVSVRAPGGGESWIETTPGRIVFNQVLPEELRRYNVLMDKKALRDLVSEVYRLTGNAATSEVLDQIKQIGFHYATVSGTTIGITDIQVPPEKAAIIAEADKEVELLEEQYEMGLITEREKHVRAVNTWQRVSGRMDEVIQQHLPEFGGIYAMAHSGARGNEAQIKQMAAMRGLMSNPRGDIIELPIKSSFREGLSVLEYFISTHGARKGLADTALRTADSGYLTRRLIDVAQEVIVLEEDCGTDRGVLIHAHASEEDVMIAPLGERIVGRVAAVPVAHPETGELLIEAGDMIEETQAAAVEAAGITELRVRSPLTCEAPRGICQQCYGRSPATGQLALLGDAVGIIAAQSIGEPGTQLTMRTFHTGGIAGKDITSGLPRVEELFEARSPKGKARIAEIDGDVLVFENGQLMGDYEAGDAPQVLVPPVSFVPCVRVVSHMPFTDSYAITATHKLVVKAGQSVQAGAIIAEPVVDSAGAKKPSDATEQVPAPVALLARVSGTVRVVDGGIEIDAFETEVRDHQVDATDQRLVRTGDAVVAGQKLTSGVKDPHDILRIEGMEATQSYLVEQVQTVYRNQGVSINDKHIETIISQMLRWVRIDNIGDTELLPNQLIDRSRFQSVNERVIAEGGEPATSKPELRGVTRASLNTDSFLAKASFQETARVLTEAAISGEVDYLRGLKENVIIGRLIPARLDVSAEGRSLLGIPELLPAAEGDSDDFETIMGLMGEVPGMDVFDDDDGAATRAAVDVDFSIDEDDEGDDDLFDDDDDDDLDEPANSAPSTSEEEEEEEESEDSEVADDDDDIGVVVDADEDLIIEEDEEEESVNG